MSTLQRSHFYGETNPTDLLEEQFGRKIAARLCLASADVPHDISERLRIARSLALAKHREAQPASARYVNSSQGAATLTLGGNENIGLWGRVASVLPLVVLLAGLIVINFVENDTRAKELADIDSALLIDDLPPSAYVDPGFTQYLKINKASAQ